MIEVEVIYAGPATQLVRQLKLDEGATVAAALSASGLIESATDTELRSLKFGIFGRLVEPGQVLNEGDRVEIYRPLLADPKLARQRRVAASRRR